MGNSEKLSTILDLCVDIDQTASEIYGSLSDYADSEALKGFWNKMVVEGETRLEYWQRLKALPEFDELPEAFDEPGRQLEQI